MYASDIGLGITLQYHCSLVPRLLPGRKTGREPGRSDHVPCDILRMCGLCDFDDQIIAHTVCTQCYKRHSGIIGALDVAVNVERLLSS